MSKANDYAHKMGYEIDEDATLDFKLRLSKKKPVTLRLPEEVISAFKKMSGKDGKYQTLMREVLIDAIKKAQ